LQFIVGLLGDGQIDAVTTKATWLFNGLGKPSARLWPEAEVQLSRSHFQSKSAGKGPGQAERGGDLPHRLAVALRACSARVMRLGAIIAARLLS
jgi:hypothetical protein